MTLFSQSRQDHSTKYQRTVGCAHVGSQPNELTERAERPDQDLDWIYFDILHVTGSQACLIIPLPVFQINPSLSRSSNKQGRT